MADLKISGRLSVEGLQRQFKKAFGVSLRIYKGQKFADAKSTLASIRKGGYPTNSTSFSVNGNLQVGNFEEKMKDVFGIKVQVANGDNTKLVDNSLRLSQAKNG